MMDEERLIVDLVLEEEENLRCIGNDAFEKAGTFESEDDVNWGWNDTTRGSLGWLESCLELEMLLDLFLPLNNDCLNIYICKLILMIK